MMRAPNKYRMSVGCYATSNHDGNNGLFFVPRRTGEAPLKIIASDGLRVPEEAAELAGWEHVSVSLPHRCPTWEEMCRVKALFWDDEDSVIQFHPPRSRYVNVHPYCLHLWRWLGGDFPLPPSILVGPVMEKA